MQVVWLVCSLSPFFAIDFDGTMPKYAGVSSILPTSEKGDFHILINLPASAQNLIRTLSNCIDSFWMIEVRADRASLCRVNKLASQPRLEENVGL